MASPVAPLVSGIVAAVAAAIVLLLLDYDTGPALVYAAIAGLLAAGVSYYQQRRRP
jgi:hypothetical protein